ncbi:uncharacterized protein EI97DRAFT_180774 [Westerdykella ornata]|uniref:Uncharacterized protein n=1 Tax=Westerdykella ornata TaxID=318751 RepID=A0A6A6JTY8_WESOR|nr:uncharacterized protein EI97DRAFT_180774 [Westerdykella ornata]KAF2279573.1 hypothetical protein EI97DRAFT_180774 [Westerdykella ornata]
MRISSSRICNHACHSLSQLSVPSFQGTALVPVQVELTHTQVTSSNVSRTISLTRGHHVVYKLPNPRPSQCSPPAPPASQPNQSQQRTSSTNERTTPTTVPSATSSTSIPILPTSLGFICKFSDLFSPYVDLCCKPHA